MPTLDEILASAKRTLAKGQRLSEEIENEVRRNKALDERYRELAENPEYTYGDVARNVVRGAAIPAAFLGGPVGLGAKAVLALEGASEFVKRPGLETGAIAALSALPGVLALRGLGRAATAARASKDAAARASKDAAAGVVDVPLRNLSRSVSTSEVREQVGRGVGRRFLRSGERRSPSEARATERKAETMERVRGGASVEQAPSGGPGSYQPSRSLSLSEGEEAGIRALDAILARTGNLRPNPFGHGTQPAATKLRRSRPKTVLKGKKAETEKRKVMFGGLRPEFKSMRPAKGTKGRPVMTKSAIRELIERLKKGEG